MNAFAGRVPWNNWTLGLHRKWHSSFGKFRNFTNCRWRKPRHCTKCICLCLETLLAISWTYLKQPFEIFTGPNSFKSTETFALREFETFQPNEVIYRAHAVKTTCRKDAGLSAARWAMPIFPHLSCVVLPQLKVFQKWFNSALFFMLQMFSFLICVQINLSSLSVYFGRLFPKVSWQSKRKRHIINYLFTSRLVNKKLITY